MEILEKFTTGIYVLGVDTGTVKNGMTVSWATQVSFEPRMVIAAVKKSRFTHGLLKQSGAFTISVLRKDQAGIVSNFKGDKQVTETSIGGVAVEKAANGAPFLKDCLGYVECKTVNEVDTGDHTLFIGEVTGGRVISDGEPLGAFDLDHIYGG